LSTDEYYNVVVEAEEHRASESFFFLLTVSMMLTLVEIFGKIGTKVGQNTK
jgi:hypothetical protein